MKLKKINENLQKALIELGYTIPHSLLKASFGTIKSGADVVLVEEDDIEKCLDACIHSIQKTEKAVMQSPRVLIMMPDKETVLQLIEKLQELGKYTDLRFYGVHDKSNFDEDKNLISIGIDILVGTPNRLNEMFGSAGFDVNQLKLWIFYELDSLLKNRLEGILYRLLESIDKPQRLFIMSDITEKTALFIENVSEDAIWFGPVADEDAS